MFARKPSSTNPTRRGTAVIELAILAPFLVFLFVIAVDWARVFYFSVTIDDCARNGACYLADPTIMGNSPHANSTQAALAGTNLSPAPTVVTANGTSTNGDWVEVTVSYVFKTVTQFPGVPSNTTLQKTVRMAKASRLPN